MPRDTLSTALLDALEHHNSNLDLDRLVEHARKNKVLLHLFRVLDIEGPERNREEDRYAATIRVLRLVAQALKGLNYSVFKFFRPVAYVPADIDLLVSQTDFSKVLGALRELGFTPVVKDLYCITLMKGQHIIDVYVHPSFMGVALMDGEDLLGHTHSVDVDGVEVVVLEPYAEATVVAVHAVMKEAIYTINDHLTLKKWLTQKTIKMAQNMNCFAVIKQALKISREIELGLIEAPHKISPPTWLKLLSTKFVLDPRMRATSLNAMRFLANPRLGKLIISRLTRESY